MYRLFFSDVDVICHDFSLPVYQNINIKLHISCNFSLHGLLFICWTFRCGYLADVVVIVAHY